MHFAFRYSSAMKTIGFVLLLAILLAGTVQYYAVLRPVPIPSDEAAILAFITRPKEYGIGVAVRGAETYPCAFIIDTAFRAFKSSTQKSAFDYRRDIIKRGLMHETGLSYWRELNLNHLASPDASPNLKALQAKTRQGCESGSIYSLTISSACAAKDDKHVYYAEQINLDDKKGRGNIYV